MQNGRTGRWESAGVRGEEAKRAWKWTWTISLCRKVAIGMMTL
jgi:hypothetical protein